MLTRHHHHRSRAFRTLSFAFLMISVSGCGSLWKARERIVTITTTETEYRDSTAWRDTTIYVPIPLESDQAIVHVGDTSHRETSVAESDAWVGKDGLIHHNLRNKTDARLPYGLKLPEHWLYTGVTNTKEHEQGVIKKEYIEKPLSWWQKFRIGAFFWLLGLVLFAYRKQILTAIMKAFGHY